MSTKKHPYKELESLKAWKTVERAIRELEANGDLQELTARPYIVGYILQQLQDANALATREIKVNGNHRSAARSLRTKSQTVSPNGVHASH